MSDLISRQDAIKELESGKDKKAKGEIGGFYNQIIENGIEKLREMPSAQPERKKGKWINHWIAPREDMLVFKCDQCGKISEGRHNFCPCCGADMRNQP